MNTLLKQKKNFCLHFLKFFIDIFVNFKVVLFNFIKYYNIIFYLTSLQKSFTKIRNNVSSENRLIDLM